jgi:hypothetical protein
MASLKSIALAATGLNNGFSLVKDFFGYRYYDGQQIFITPLSVKKQIKLAKGRSIHLSIILVGYDGTFGGNSVVTRKQVRNMQTAIQRTRDLYAQAPLGIRKLYWSWIPLEDSGNYLDITDGDEAEDLTDDWHGDNDGIDVFFVQTIANADGYSTTDGPCDKETLLDQTGAVLALNNPNTDDTDNHEFFGVIVAHEIAHYLGLRGGVGPTNLMGADVIPEGGDGIDEVGKDTTNINSYQADTMRSGCFVKNAL